MGFGIHQVRDRDWDFEQNVRVRGNLESSDRYELKEYFHVLPGLNADVAPASADDGVDGATAAEIALMLNTNKNFELLGTNASSDDVTWSSTFAGIQLQTDGGDNDQVILLPHLDTGLSAWTGVVWGTENQVIWETLVRTDSSIASIGIWAGLKLTNTFTIATDADQVMFRFSTDDSDTNWQVIDSIGGTDVTTDAGVAVAASTNYKLRIEIDSDRVAHCYINGVKVRQTTALTNDINLIPYVGVMALTGAAKTIHVGYEKISRIWFE